MPTRPPADPVFARTLSAGRCHLYVLPCAYEDILKLGHSREPLVRMQALHPRYFEFFDLDRAWLVETDTVREARDLELRLGRAITVHNAPSPLVVRRAAAGHTEWYRGAFEPLGREADSMVDAGYVVHRGLRPWLRHQLLQRSDRLHSWATRLLDQAEPAYGEPFPASARDALDAYAALDIDVQALLPAEFWRSYRPAAR
jgi:hypothetical protein